MANTWECFENFRMFFFRKWREWGVGVLWRGLEWSLGNRLCFSIISSCLRHLRADFLNIRLIYLFIFFNVQRYVKLNWTPGHSMEVRRHWVLDTQGVIQRWLVWGFPVESPGVRWRKQKYTDGVTVLRCSPESLDRYRRPRGCAVPGVGGGLFLLDRFLALACAHSWCICSVCTSHTCTCPVPFAAASGAWIRPCGQCFSHVRPGQIISRGEVGLAKCQMFERRPGCYAGIVRKITVPFGESEGGCSWITFRFFSRDQDKLNLHRFRRWLMQIYAILHQMRTFL